MRWATSQCCPRPPVSARRRCRTCAALMFPVTRTKKHGGPHGQGDAPEALPNAGAPSVRAGVVCPAESPLIRLGEEQRDISDVGHGGRNTEARSAKGSVKAIRAVSERADRAQWDWGAAISAHHPRSPAVHRSEAALAERTGNPAVAGPAVQPAVPVLSAPGPRSLRRRR